VNRRNEVVVGAVVLLAIALLIVGTIWLKGTGFGREETEIRARFGQVGQLLKGNAVKLRGVPIGRVESIELDPAGTGVIITMAVDSRVRFPEDPVVILSPESMFGDWQAEIFPRRNFASYDYAEDPDPTVLPGYSLPDISQLTAVAADIADNMSTLSDRFEIAFTDETADNIRKAIQNIQQVSDQLTGMVDRQQRAIDEVATNLSQTSESLGKAAETVQRAFAQVETAVGDDRLVSIVANVERASAQTDSLTRELLSTSRQLRAVAATADTTFRSVGAVADRINRGEGSLGRLLADTSLYYGVVETNAEIARLLKDIRENPRRYINLRIF
jgi:phospholipid/cholesterol/gamma-HCH transport system substrate-binding protein